MKDRKRVRLKERKNKWSMSNAVKEKNSMLCVGFPKERGKMKKGRGEKKVEWGGEREKEKNGETALYCLESSGRHGTVKPVWNYC